MVTVLFADLAGFTATAERMDPEEVHAFLEPLMSGLHDVVRSYGGTIVNTMGDGFFAVFGAPTAHADDAERAIRAAVALRDSVRASSIEGIDLHAGIHTGWVFIAPTESGFDVLGDTVNTASRIAALAGPGVILAGAPTRTLAARIATFTPLEPAAVKGKKQPVETYEIAAVRPGPAWPLEPTRTPFVGRTQELATIATTFAGVTKLNRSDVLVIGGAPGVGKSRLVGEATRDLPGATVLAGRSIPYGERIPWLALASALRASHVFARLETNTDRLGALRESVNEAMPGLSEADSAMIVKRLGSLLGSDASDARRRASGGAWNLEVAATVRRFVSALAEDAPVVIVLDDLQWSDPQVLEFVRWMRADPWPAPVLLIALAHDDALAELELEADVLVRALGDDEGDALVRHLLTEADVPPPVSAELQRRAGGNPLFLQEFVRLLRDRGELAAEGGRWGIVEGARPEVPQTVHLVVASRIDDLPALERKVLRDAAVCGPTFARSALIALGWDEVVDELCASLERRALITRVDGAEYAFRHSVIHDVAYEGVSRMERAEKHLVVAAWLRAQAPSEADEPIEMLAHHYGRAAAIGLFTAQNAIAPQAVDYLTKAGDRAYAQRAMQAAESWYRQALEIDPQSVQRAAREGSASLHVLLRHADVLHELGKYTSARAEASLGFEIAKTVDDEAHQAEALLHIAWLDSLFGNVDEARRMLAIASEIADENDDAILRARVLRAIADTWRLSDYLKMVELMGQAAAMFGAAGDGLRQLDVVEDLAYVHTIRGGEAFARWFGENERLVQAFGDVRSRAALERTEGLHLFYLGRHDEAEPLLASCLAVARNLGDVFIEVDALFALAKIWLAQSRVAEASEAGAGLIRLGRGQGLRRTEAHGMLVRALVAEREGRSRASDELLDRAAALLEEIGAEHEQVEVLGARAQIAIERERWDDAARMAAECRALLERFGDTLEVARIANMEQHALARV